MHNKSSCSKFSLCWLPVLDACMIAFSRQHVPGVLMSESRLVRVGPPQTEVISAVGSSANKKRKTCAFHRIRTFFS